METETKQVKAKKTPEEILELVIVIMLGVTALMTAWASWIGSLHGGNQSTNYTTSNNLSADGNARWNEASQQIMQDMITWNTMDNYRIDLSYAEQQEDEAEIERLTWKTEEIYNNCSADFQAAIDWAISTEGSDNQCTPFEMEGYIDSYYEDARAVLAEADEVLTQGKADNANGDAFGLVTVIYSVVLFLLGIVGTFKSFGNKIAVTIISVVAFLASTVYMLTLPLPTGFDLLSFLH